MKIVITVLFCGFISLNLQASELGIGTSIRSDEDIIYVPFTVHQDLRVEGVIGLDSSKSSNKTGSTSSSNYDSDYYVIGAGLYKTKRTSENGTYYYGFRAAYIRSKSNSSSGTSTGSTDNSGYYLAPVIGFEYYISTQFTIGVDVGYIYNHWSGESENTLTTNEAKTTSRMLDKSFLVRYYF